MNTYWRTRAVYLYIKLQRNVLKREVKESMAITVKGERLNQLIQKLGYNRFGKLSDFEQSLYKLQVMDAMSCKDVVPAAVSADPTPTKVSKKKSSD